MSATSDRDAFIRAIIAESDDDAPRLVFADWLDENGEPERAEFIRVQCALAQLAEGESDPDLVNRQRTLSQRHAATWLAELPTMAGVKPSGFHRGFVQRVAFANLKAFRLHSATVADYPVHAMTFSRLSPGTTRSLVGMPELMHVRSLSLGRSGADAASLAALFRSPHLIRLRRLDLDDSLIGPEVMEAIGQHLILLERLTLKYCLVNDECAALFARVAALPRLRELFLLNVPLADAGVRALAEASGLPSLRRLHLNSIGIRDAAAVALARSRSLGALRHLSLQQTRMSAQGLAALVARTSLESMEVKYDPSVDTQLTPEPPRVIGPSAEQRQLQLNGGRLDDEGLAALVRSPGFETITTLNILNNPVTEVGLQALANIPKPIALRQIKLIIIRVKASAVETLLLSPRLAKLEGLHLELRGPGTTEPASEPSLLPATVSLSVTGDPPSLAWLARSASLRRVRELSINGAELPLLIGSPYLTELEELSLLSAGPGEVRALIGATHLRLKRLALPHGKQGDATTRILADAPHLANLRELELASNGVSDAGALALAASPNLDGLRKLDLRRNAISADAARRLRERFGARVLLSEPREA